MPPPPALPHRPRSNNVSAAALLGCTPRKCKRPLEIEAHYTEIQEVDSHGRVRDVIIIEDSPPPSASPSQSRQIQTSSMQPLPYTDSVVRIQARPPAASSSLSANGPAAKKRRVGGANALSRKPIASHFPTNVSTNNSYAGGNDADDVTEKRVACDDKEGHYIVAPDDLINKRYRTVKLLGQGTFGKVVEAVDQDTGKRVAVKIIRAIPKYRDASKMEVRVLQKLKEQDPKNKFKCIHLLNWFDHRNHICLVSELLGKCVYDFLKENEFAPFPRHHIQSFARQLLGSVAFLHDLRLIHTDLKPENILLVKNDFRVVPMTAPGRRTTRAAKQKRLLENTDIRLIDFGSATFEDEYHSSIVSTRHYRAPEIILGLGWSFPCDAFSLGCILVEFYTGVALFQTHDNLEHLAMMEQVMGKMPVSFARRGARSKPEFFQDDKLYWPPLNVTTASKKDVNACRSLQEIIPSIDEVNRQFLDLVKKLLIFDPFQRITVREALNHPYFKLNIPSEI
ncbi:kinase-like protein [Laetiporus sulphureus 93-53]|uniref:Kinase-like protein n=1 Tax=Laetiporus sulphureus 93-53 TaxID=1314785 RepID=A0A165ESZ4_9APHY|nr:kinase-like protein [Laetiporus sulphureus 93-53]KZT07693.1 kinase-like protein [Laetiporus sulphureus 93-53]